MNTFLHLWQYLTEFFLEWEMFQIKVVEEINVHILCSVIIFKKNRAVYEIMSKNVVEPERPQITIWRRVAYWVSKATRAQTHITARASTPTSIHACTR
jgi:hypothetical protein